jgi:hypothetical protein
MDPFLPAEYHCKVEHSSSLQLRFGRTKEVLYSASTRTVRVCACAAPTPVPTGTPAPTTFAPTRGPNFAGPTGKGERDRHDLTRALPLCPSARSAQATDRYE